MGLHRRGTRLVNTVDEYVDQLENNMSIAYEYAREMLNKVAITRKERYDCNVKVT